MNEPFALDELRGIIEGYSEGHALLRSLRIFLEKKGWSGTTIQFAEALPHYTTIFSLSDLKKTLHHLGYTLDLITMRGYVLDERLCPVIFIEHNGNASVFADSDGAIVHYDEFGAAHPIETPIRLEGTLCIIKEKAEKTKKHRWFRDVFLGSRSSMMQLVLLALFSNTFFLMPSLYVMFVYDHVLKVRSSETLLSFLIGVLMAITAYCLIQKRKRKLIANLSANSIEQVDEHVLHQILKLPANYTEVASVPSQIARLQDFDASSEFFAKHLLNALIEFPFVFIYLAGFYYFAGPLVWLPILGIVAYLLLFALRLIWDRYFCRSVENLEENWRGFLIESIHKLYPIRLAHFEAKWLQRFSEKMARAVYFNYQSSLKQQITEAISEGGLLLLALGVLVFGVILIERDELTVGGLIASMIIIWRLMNPIRVLFSKAHHFIHFRHTLSQIERIANLNQEEYNTVTDLPKIYGEIEFNQVGLRYTSDRDPALVGVTFKINPGELVVLTGPNGSGKSTLLKLLLRVYQAQIGSIILDGQDIRQIPHNILRKCIAYVPQTPQFFYGTISQNLRLANPTATKEDLEQVCEATFLLDEIKQLPYGFETRIYDHHMNQLPASFKQRLQLARSLLVNAPILLLDEPASHLDGTHDEKFIALLNQLKGRRTILMSSHRPSHFGLADKVIFLENGQVTKIDKVGKSMIRGKHV